MGSTSTTESIYEERLVTLYSSLVTIFDQHTSHRIRPLSTIDDDQWDSMTGRICAQETRCDHLNDVIDAEIERTFPRDQDLAFLWEGLLDVPTGGVDFRYEPCASLREIIRDIALQAINYDVHTRRLFPDRAVLPVHPALTHPSMSMKDDDR